MQRLNVIGAGNVGQTLAYLWSKAKVFKIAGVTNSTLASAEKAVAFIGAGEAVESIRSLPPADVVMISTSDSKIEDCASALADAAIVSPGTVVFHCSGALSSSALSALDRLSATVASVHPAKSFPNPIIASQTFKGTYCGVEGEIAACTILRLAFEQIGGIVFPVNSNSKSLYHAANVFTCNYLTALLELAIRCFNQAGVSTETSMALMSPFVTETLANIFKLGPVKALTGPIARGDYQIVSRHRSALAHWNTDAEQLYCLLGKIAAELSEQQGKASQNSLQEIREILGRVDT